MRPPASGSNVYCVGILGRLFGHKYTKSGWTNNNGCYRCGKPEGAGWVRKE